jgi:hypothetical protein
VLLYLVSMFATSDDSKSTINPDGCYAIKASFEDARSDRTRIFSDLLAKQASSLPHLQYLSANSLRPKKHHMITH